MIENLPSEDEGGASRLVPGPQSKDCWSTTKAESILQNTCEPLSKFQCPLEFVHL